MTSGGSKYLEIKRQEKVLEMREFLFNSYSFRGQECSGVSVFHCIEQRGIADVMSEL